MCNKLLCRIVRSTSYRVRAFYIYKYYYYKIIYKRGRATSSSAVPATWCAQFTAQFPSLQAVNCAVSAGST